MIAITDVSAIGQHKVFVVTTTSDDCVKTCFCEELHRRGCSARCVKPQELRVLYRDDNYSVLIDCVNPQSVPDVEEVIRILHCTRPRPRSIAILLPEQDYNHLQQKPFSCPVMFHLHQEGDAMERVFNFLLSHNPDV